MTERKYITCKRMKSLSSLTGSILAFEARSLVLFNFSFRNKINRVKLGFMNVMNLCRRHVRHGLIKKSERELIGKQNNLLTSKLNRIWFCSSSFTWQPISAFYPYQINLHISHW
jgi:hypothetical protein